MTGGYDSRPDTREHIDRVQRLLFRIRHMLFLRGLDHDNSKLVDPEKAAFDRFTPELRGLTYGSPEYRSCLAEMRPALQHHYEHNSHHPEHYPEGIAGMSLLDLIEMLVDWKAAGERHDDGDIRRSIEINRERFGISEQLASVLLNTAEEMGW